MEMEIIITDATGRLAGKVKGFTLYNAKGEKVYQANPEKIITIDEIVRILLSSSQKYVV